MWLTATSVTGAKIEATHHESWRDTSSSKVWRWCTLQKKIHIDEGNSPYLFLCESREYTLQHFLAGARDTPDHLPGDFCHHTVDDTDNAETREKKYSFKFVLKIKEPSRKWEKTSKTVSGKTPLWKEIFHKTFWETFLWKLSAKLFAKHFVKHFCKTFCKTFLPKGFEQFWRRYLSRILLNNIKGAQLLTAISSEAHHELNFFIVAFRGGGGRVYSLLSQRNK